LTSVSLEKSVEPDWEYAPLRIGPDVSRLDAAVQLSVRAEFGGWELARVRRYEDGTRRVELRRRRRPGNPSGGGVLPLPDLPR
jgi:hypothetical protein